MVLAEEVGAVLALEGQEVDEITARVVALGADGEQGVVVLEVRGGCAGHCSVKVRTEQGLCRRGRASGVRCCSARLRQPASKQAPTLLQISSSQVAQ